MLIIFGTKACGKIVKKGQFNCFRCNEERSYDLIRYKKYFALFFIPLIPLSNCGDTLECNTCKTHYDPCSVLSVTEYNFNIPIDKNFQQIASGGKRIGAYLIDLFFLILLNFPLAAHTSNLPDFFDDKFYLVFLPFWVIYFFLLEVLFKGTIGKKIIGIKTVSNNTEDPITILRYFSRSIVKCIPVINIVLLFNEKHRGCHDFLSNTIVIEK